MNLLESVKDFFGIGGGQIGQTIEPTTGLSYDEIFILDESQDPKYTPPPGIIAETKQYFTNLVKPKEELLPAGIITYILLGTAAYLLFTMKGLKT